MIKTIQLFLLSTCQSNDNTNSMKWSTNLVSFRFIVCSLRRSILGVNFLYHLNVIHVIQEYQVTIKEIRFYDFNDAFLTHSEGFGYYNVFAGLRNDQILYDSKTKVIFKCICSHIKIVTFPI